MKRICPKCGTSKKIFAFYKRKGSHTNDEHTYVCKKCLRIKSKEYDKKYKIKFIDMNKKRECPKCNKVKPLIKFGSLPTSHTGDGRNYICKKCIALRAKKYRKNSIKYKRYIKKRMQKPCEIFKRIRRRALYFRNIKFNLTKEEFMKWYEITPKICSYCEIDEKTWNRLKFSSYATQFKRFTIDRMNNKIGYQIDNIVLACFHCNVIKNNVFSFKEMKEIAMKYIKPKWEQFNV